MQRRVVGVYLIEIEKSESEYSLFANVDGNRLLLLYCSENELNKLTDSEILEMVNFKKSVSDPFSSARKSFWEL